MRKMNQSLSRYALIFALLIIFPVSGTSQTALPDILTNSTLKEQMNYIQERTRIYENYRAIREDMFQKIKNNAIDSLSKSKIEISDLKNLTLVLSHRIDSLSTSLQTTKNSLDEITATKNSISILGMEVNKITYNSIMGIIIAGLLALLALGFLVFKRNMVTTLHTKKELESLKNEFEVYRQTTREAREKMSMDHFNELKRLKR
ncbi:MAG TPA: hypothetical protein VMV77_16515 [Bacteroidales bacterium]|nr:hypothetical protein [Bacteroidales bacterium]